MKKMKHHFSAKLLGALLTNARSWSFSKIGFLSNIVWRAYPHLEQNAKWITYNHPNVDGDFTDS